MLQASRDSQALQLIPGGNRGMREGSGEGGGAGTAGTHWEVVSTEFGEKHLTFYLFINHVIF